MKKLCFSIVAALCFFSFTETLAQSSVLNQGDKTDYSGVLTYSSQDETSEVLEKAARIYGVSEEELTQQYESGEVLIQPVGVHKYWVDRHGNEVLVIVDSF